MQRPLHLSIKRTLQVAVLLVTASSLLNAEEKPWWETLVQEEESQTLAEKQKIAHTRYQTFKRLSYPEYSFETGYKILKKADETFHEMSLKMQSKLLPEHRQIQQFYGLPLINHELLFELNLIKKRLPQKNTKLLELLKHYLRSTKEVPQKNIEELFNLLWQGKDIPKLDKDSRFEFLHRYSKRYY